MTGETAGDAAGVSLVRLVQQLSQLRHLSTDSAHLCQAIPLIAGEGV